MPTPINEVRTKSNRVKNHILNRFLLLADEVDATGTCKEPMLYKELLLTFAKNVVPRSQEITGEDGAPLNITFDRTFNESSTTPETTGDSKEQSQV